MFDPQLTVGDLITAIAVLVSAVGILVELRKDRDLRRKELADKVRRSAGLIVAKLDRWRQLSQHFFNQAHTLITDTDVLLVREQNIINARDFLWKELFALKADADKRKMDEQIEASYADLYGYDPRIHDLFAGVTERLRKIDALIFQEFVQQSQDNVLDLEEARKPFVTAILGNMLRRTAASFAAESDALTEEVLGPFRGEMVRLVNASDADIAARRFVVRSSAEVLPEIPVSLQPSFFRSASGKECLFADLRVFPPLVVPRQLGEARRLRSKAHNPGPEPDGTAGAAPRG
jgi:hypothetical protein